MRTPGAGVEMMTFSTVLARHGVGGGASRRRTGTMGILPVGVRGGVFHFNGRDARCPSRGDMNNRWGQIEAAQ